MRYQHLVHRFVTHVPRDLEAGVLYISIDYATAVHACCCGCGERVVTPITPTDWRLTFDGESVTLHPSVGNWNQNCRSHYLIRQNRVLQAGSWSQDQVEAERLRDKRAKAAHFSQREAGQPDQTLSTLQAGTGQEQPASTTLWAQLKAWFRR